MLTVLIPCKNERDHIRRCVASARLVADEVLVADRGSTDGTLDLIAELGDCRLIEREFIGYASFKNWAIPQATHDWVLILDADERITLELTNEIRAVVQSPTDTNDAYWIGRRTFFLGYEARYGPWLNDGAVRLIRRDRCRYDRARVHEGIEVDADRLGRLSGKLMHYSIDSYDDYFAKYVKYTRLGAADRWDRGCRASGWKMLASPIGRFLWLYLIRGGFLDGAIGVQTCMLQALFVTFVKQGRLWEREHRREVEETAEPMALQMRPEQAAGNQRAA